MPFCTVRHGLSIPPQLGGASTVSSQPAAGDGDGDSDDGVVSDDAAAPVSSSAAAAPVNSSTAAVGGGSYVVQPGDTLSAIAARAGMSVAQLAAANGLELTGPLLSGSALRLSASVPAGQAAPVSTASASSGGSYVVQPGDTLSAIAARATDQLKKFHSGLKRFMNPHRFHRPHPGRNVDLRPQSEA